MMKDLKGQLKLQAYVDGQLPKTEVAEVEAWIARDREAAAAVTTVRHTKAALKSYEQTITLPESREFFWSKIERQIQGQEQRTARAASASAAPAAWILALRRILVPAGALAAVVLAFSLASKQGGLTGSPQQAVMEAAIGSPGTLTYRNFATRTTLVWLSYPAENGLAQ